MGLGGIMGGVGDIANQLVDNLTGSDALGDIAQIGIGLFTGNPLDTAKGVSDLGENVGQFMGGVGKAAQDAFLGGAGGCTNPANTPAPTGAGSGCADPASAGGAEGAKGGTLEERIFALLMKLFQSKSGEVEDQLGKTEGADKDSQQMEMFKLQKANGELKGLESMITGLIQSFNESTQAIARNIR